MLLRRGPCNRVADTSSRGRACCQHSTASAAVSDRLCLLNASCSMCRRHQMTSAHLHKSAEHHPHPAATCSQHTAPMPAPNFVIGLHQQLTYVLPCLPSAGHPRSGWTAGSKKHTSWARHWALEVSLLQPCAVLQQHLLTSTCHAWLYGSSARSVTRYDSCMRGTLLIRRWLAQHVCAVAAACRLRHCQACHRPQDWGAVCCQDHDTTTSGCGARGQREHKVC